MVTQKLAFCWTASLVEEKKWAKSFGLLGRNLALPVRLDPHDLKSSERKKHWDSYSITLSAECPCDKVLANEEPACL